MFVLVFILEGLGEVIEVGLYYIYKVWEEQF